MAEVPVQAAAIAITVHQLAQVAQIWAEFFRSDGRVLPALPRKGLARNISQHA